MSSDSISSITNALNLRGFRIQKKPVLSHKISSEVVQVDSDSSSEYIFFTYKVQYL